MHDGIGFVCGCCGKAVRFMWFAALAGPDKYGRIMPMTVADHDSECHWQVGPLEPWALATRWGDGR